MKTDRKSSDRVPFSGSFTGYSIPAQLKLLREYARTHEFHIVHEFIDVETAKTTGRKQFGEMVRFFRKNEGCRVAIVEKTDRLLPVHRFPWEMRSSSVSRSGAGRPPDSGREEHLHS